MRETKNQLIAQEAAGLIVIGVGVVVMACPFAAIWMAWGFGPMVAALVMLVVGIWIGRR